MKKIFFRGLIFLFFKLTSYVLAAQPAPVAVESIGHITPIDNNTYVFTDTTGLSAGRISFKHFAPLNAVNKKIISSRELKHTFYARFHLSNASARVVRIYYYPGKLFKELQLYTIGADGDLRPIQTRGLVSGFIPIDVQPGTNGNYLLRSRFFKTSINDRKSILIPTGELAIFKARMYGFLDINKTVGIGLSGMLILMILATFLNYFVSGKVEFLYHSCYSFCMFVLIFLTTYLAHHPGWIRGFFLSYFDLVLLVGGTISYLAFTRYFLDTKKLHPKLNKFLYVEAWALAILLVLYSILHFGFSFYSYEVIIEIVLKVMALAAGIVYIYLSLVQKNRLMNYLAFSAGTQVIFFTISLVLNFKSTEVPGIFASPFFYFELGVLCSISFVLLGLFYKNRQELTMKVQEQEAMKLASEKRSFENQLSIYKVQQEERNRISADMHDDLGAGMTAIRLYSELAKSKSAPNVLPEIEKISASSDELINKMNAIIWSMSSHNDTLDNMVAYIRSYCTDYFENTGITPKILVPERIPAIVVNGVIRRNVFLVVKEALQNILKHASATEVRIELEKEGQGLSLVIHDNGKGIDLNNIRNFSNGLKNMKKRMADVEIDFVIENDNGTRIKLFRQTR